MLGAGRAITAKKLIVTVRVFCETLLCECGGKKEEEEGRLVTSVLF